ncbi:hypothetical protein GCM10007862_02010 [Dyella lipolytica]|uniref:Uncharacterized protein n=1 Tax=Dyella lipolytica TaxID=1867835 RepID=A0ABW8IT45_9GAMM|nr:hypothetical protein [Dyella lipolytica]GLQ45150.1 hypothetical protein GCM10007862_02010 [Dyella lipolytica]
MKASTFLRIASAIAFLFAIGHTMGVPWTPATDAPESALLASMKSLHFPVMGTDRSYWDFYVGFGVSISVYLFTQAIVLWQMASLARSDAKRVRPLIVTFFVSYLAMGAITLRYFFVVPIVLTVAMCICLALACLSAWRRDAGM